MSKTISKTNGNRVKGVLGQITRLSARERADFIEGLRHITDVWEDIADISDILRQKASPRLSYRNVRKELEFRDV